MSPTRKRALVAAVAGGTALTTTTTASAAGTAAKAKAVIGLSLIKWTAAGVVSAAVIAGGVASTIVRRDEQAPAHVASVQPLEGRAPNAPMPSAPPVSGSAAVAGASARAPGVAPDASSAPAVAQVPSARRPAPPPVPTIADELRLIEQARAAIAAGDIPVADRALDAHARTYPSGVFAEEARVLRIDAMVGRGERARGEAAARTYLAAHPDSPHAPRLRALIGEGR